jgi:hypothetical protein
MPSPVQPLFRSALTWFLVRLLRRRTCTSPGNKTLQPHGEPAPPNYRGIFRTNRRHMSHTMSRRLPINKPVLEARSKSQHTSIVKLFLSSPSGRHRFGKRCRPTLIAPIIIQLAPCRVSRHTKNARTVCGLRQRGIILTHASGPPYLA